MTNSDNKIISFINQHKYFILILLGGAFLRFYHLGVESYWLDEGQSIDYVINFKKYLQNYFAGIDSNHPPLYYLLLYFWSYLGTGEYIARSLSVVIGLLTIVILYYFVNKWYSKSIGLIAALLLSLSTFHLQYCQEVREYALLIFFSLLGIFSFISYIQENKPKYLWHFCIFSILGFWTHYFYIFTFVYLNLIYLLLFRKYNLKFKNWFLVSLIVSLAIIPILVPLFKVFFIPVAKGASTDIEWLRPPNIYSLKDSFISDLSSTSFLLPNESINPLFRKLTKLLFLSLFLFGIYPKNIKKIQIFDPTKTYFLFFGFVLFYITSVYLISIYFKPIFLSRYLIPILPAYLIVLANGINNLKLPPIKHLAIILISAISLTSTYTFFTSNAFKKDQYREAACFIQEKEKEGDVICLNSSWPGITFNYYYKGSLPKKSFTNKQDYNKELIEHLLNNYKRIWLVSSNTGILLNEDVYKSIENYSPHVLKIKEINFINVKLYLYQIMNKKQLDT